MNNQNMNWLILFFVMFFGFSIMSSAAGFLVLFLGLPYEWSCGISLLTLGTIFYLFYNRYAPMAWGLAFCVGFIGLSVVTIGRGLIMQEPSIPEGMKAYLNQQELQSVEGGWFLGFTEYYYYLDDDNTFFADENTGIIFPGYEPSARIPVTFEFPQLRTRGGQWAFADGSVTSQGALNGTFEADPKLNWLSADEANFDASAPAGIAAPYMLIELPIAQFHQNKDITLAASLDITYPDVDTGETTHADLSRTVEVYVASDNYYLYMDQYANYKRARRVIDTPIWLLMVVGSVVAGGASVYFWRNGALTQRQGSGSLIFEVKRATGSQKLGIEAHDLTKISDGIPPLQEGVFVGWVNPQSPAGRAGLLSGDILVSINDKAITQPKQVNRVAGGFKRGEVAQVVVVRGSETLTFMVKF